MEDLPKEDAAPNDAAGHTPAASPGAGSHQVDSPVGEGLSATEVARDVALPYLGLGAATEPIAQAPGIIFDGVYPLQLHHAYSGRVLTGYRDENTGDHHLRMADDNDGDSQLWVLANPHEHSPLVTIGHNKTCSWLTYEPKLQTLKLESNRLAGDPAILWRVCWDKPGERCRLVHEASGLMLDSNGQQVYMHVPNEGTYQRWDCLPASNNARQTFSRPLRGGVLIIGSLLWQIDRTREPGGRGRQFWRDFFLAPSSARTKVFAPIRYGRYSRLPKQVRPSSERWEAVSQWAWQLEYADAPINPADVNDENGRLWQKGLDKQSDQPNADSGGVYTMVFSREADKNQTLGQAWVWPFRTPVRNLRGLAHQVLGLAQAEGIAERSPVTGPLLGEEKYGYAPFLDHMLQRAEFLRALLTTWGMVTLLISPKCPPEDRALLTSLWEEALRNYENMKKPGEPAGWYTDQFSADREESCVAANGQLDLQPLYTVEKGQPLFDETDLDFVLATVTAPQTKGKKRTYASDKNIASHIVNDTRKYFQTNCEQDIRTADDEVIWAEVRRLYQQQEPRPARHLPLNPPYPPKPNPEPYYPDQDL